MANRPKKSPGGPTGGTVDSWNRELVRARIRERMASAGYDQSELARLAGVNQSQISRLLSGARIDGVSIRTLYGIAPHLDCSLEVLLGLDQAPNRGKPSTMPPPPLEYARPPKKRQA